MMIARIGMPYSATDVNAARSTVNGTSFCGSFISSPAALGSSKPTKLKNSPGTRPMNSAYDGENSETDGECSPCLKAYRITLNVKKPSSRIRAHAPSVGIHLPMPNESTAAHTPNQMNANENRYWPTSPRSPKKVLNVVTAVMHSRPPIQTGFDNQYRTELIDATKRPQASFVTHNSRPRR